MNSTLRSNRWILTSGIPLVSILALSACTPSLLREPLDEPLKKSGTAYVHAKSSPTISSLENTPAAEDDQNSIAAAPSEERGTASGVNIDFADGDSVLREESIKLLRRHSEYLKLNPKRYIILRAYLDGLGSRTFSLAITQKRLNVVSEALQEQGVAKSRIRQVMLGQRGKKLTCETPSCQSRTRRIELLYK